MSTHPPVDPERLAAYADGELPPDEAAAVKAAIAADPALAEQLAAHRALRATLAAHFAPILDAPVPARLTDLLAPRESATVVDLAAARQSRAAVAAPAKRDRPRWAFGGALAASLALGLLFGTQLPRGGTITDSGGALVASGALDKALSTQLASAGEQGGTRILLSFRTAQGGYCRGFESGATAGIACRAAGRWAILRSESTGGSEAASAYRQAGSAQAAIMAAAQEMAAGPALDETGERTARAAGWQR
jgi:hypothetical protein